MTRAKLAQVFEGGSFASPGGDESGALPLAERLASFAPVVQAAPGAWPWVASSTPSSPPLGVGSNHASESDVGLSEASDWDQVKHGKTGNSAAW